MRQDARAAALEVSGQLYYLEPVRAVDACGRRRKEKERREGKGDGGGNLAEASRAWTKTGTEVPGIQTSVEHANETTHRKQAGTNPVVGHGGQGVQAGPASSRQRGAL